MNKEGKNPCSVKNNHWVAEIRRGKVVGNWSFSIPPKVKIKDFDNSTYEESKDFQEGLVNIIITTTDAIRDYLKSKNILWEVVKNV